MKLAQGGEVCPAEIRQYCQTAWKSLLVFVDFYGVVASTVVEGSIECDSARYKIKWEAVNPPILLDFMVELRGVEPLAS